jgi:hypothetical protein
MRAFFHANPLLSLGNGIGSPISPGSGFAGVGIDMPTAIAIYSSGNVWVAILAGNSLDRACRRGHPGVHTDEWNSDSTLRKAINCQGVRKGHRKVAQVSRISSKLTAVLVTGLLAIALTMLGSVHAAIAQSVPIPGNPRLRAPTPDAVTDAPQVLLNGQVGFAPSDMYTFYDSDPLFEKGVQGNTGSCIALIEAGDYIDQ